MPVIDRIVAGCLICVVCIGPWTTSVAHLFALQRFEETAVVDMAWYMVKKIPLSFAYGAPYFIGVPLTLLVLRFRLPRYATLLQVVVLWIAMAASIVALPVLCIAYNSRQESNIIGQVLATDMMTMWVWHATLCLYEFVPAWTLVGGPLFGLCMYIQLEGGRPSSLLGGVAALYSNISSLYDAYLNAEREFGDVVFSQTVGLNRWYGYEIYAAVTVVGGFIVICASAPAPRRWTELVEMILYIILLNSNVAAAWIASVGIMRPPLVRPNVVFRWHSHSTVS